MDENYGSIFDKLDGDNHKLIERTLLSLTAISFEFGQGGIDFYYNIGKYTLVFNLNLESINRLLIIANQLQNRLCLYAMDALRNLVVQAFLIDKVNFA